MPALSRRKSEAGDRRDRAALSRRFTVRYIFAVLLLAGVAVVGQLATGRSGNDVEAQSLRYATASDELSQVYKVDALAKELGANIATTEGGAQAQELQAELSDLRRLSQALTRGDADIGIPADSLSPKSREIFYDNGLDQALTNLFDKGSELVSRAGTSATGTPATDVPEILAAIDADAAQGRAGLDNLLALYEEELRVSLSTQRDTSLMVLGVVAMVATAVALGLFRPMGRSISSETGQLEQAEQEHRLNNERQTFRNTLKETLESADTEEEVLATLGRAVRAVVPGLAAEILLVNATESRLVRGVDISDHGAPMCPVESPMGCAAFRRSQTEVYESSRMLNACPKLAAHENGPCSAVCVPLKFRGRALGVLHTTAEDARPPSHTQIERLTTIASETGIQLGTVRATQSDRLQATTDGLTGLLNRRSIETAVTGLLAESRPFSVALGDLDHFKDLNDTYGHEAGDTALKLFARVMKANLRPEDVAARYGGEEFLLILPDTNIREAQAALERLQSSLVVEIEKGKVVPFTASWGLTDNSAGTRFDEMVGVADAALYSAKRAGRNCIYVDGEAASAFQELTPDQIWTAADSSKEPVPPAPVRRSPTP